MGSRGPDLSKAIGQITDDLSSMSEDMKGAANSCLLNLKSDQEKLENIAEKQERSLDDVRAQTEKGKKLLWSSSLGFLCTMVLLLISIVIFFMMIPFIIFT